MALPYDYITAGLTCHTAVLLGVALNWQFKSPVDIVANTKAPPVKTNLFQKYTHIHHV